MAFIAAPDPFVVSSLHPTGRGVRCVQRADGSRTVFTVLRM